MASSVIEDPWDSDAPLVKITRPVRERTVEQRGDRYAKKFGFKAYKLKVVGQDGFPDKVYLGRGKMLWWEWKKLGEEPEPHQYERMKELREAGQKNVGWSGNFEDFKTAFDKLFA